jgi:nucleotide-binding universal stress UspA family protein
LNLELSPGTGFEEYGRKEVLPFKKILCPTDFSDPSLEGLKAATEVADFFSGELLLLNVVPIIDPLPYPDAPAHFNVAEYQKEMLVWSKRELDELSRERIPPHVSFRTHAVEGNPPEEIIRLAQSERVDAIVIATHGRTGWRHLVFGSVAEKVVRLAPCPVITIPAPKKER